MITNISEDMKLQIETVIEEARRISVDVAQEVEEIFQQGNEHPLDRGKAFELLTKIISVLKRNADERGDDATSNSLAGDINQIIQRVIQMREPVISESTKATAPTKIKLVPHNGIDPRPRLPKQRFQGVEVPMYEGYVKTIDIPLWTENPRTEIELAQFRKENNGRDPNPEQRLELMWGNEDIEELAKDIALNGVHTPPIIAVDGTLLDGNRRIAACQYILHNKSKEFDDKAFKNAEYIWIWQLTEHATEEDKQRVIVARNFGSDHKKDWTKYTKAKQVYKAWQEMSSRSRGKINKAEIVKILAHNFKLQPNQFNRLIETMQIVENFREYHNEKGGDTITYDVENVVDRYYAYLEKIASSREVKYELENKEIQDLIFDLLFDGKFTKDEQFNKGVLVELIREPDALEKLKEAQKETKEEGRKTIEDEINRLKSKKKPREITIDKKIKQCIDTLNLLNRVSCDKIGPPTLKSLLQTLKSVLPMLEEICKQKDEV